MFVSPLNSKIMPYSLIKRIANKNPPYSILNPETNSDSPSEKSKGVRLVSATQLMSHVIKTGKKIPVLTKYLSHLQISVSLKLFPSKQILNKIKAKLIS